MHILKSGGQRRGSVVTTSLSEVGGNAVLLFLIYARAGGEAYSSGVRGRYIVKREKLPQIVRDFNEERINLTPLMVIPAQYQIPLKYCTSVMFARFFCALFGFCTHEFPAKSEKNLGYFSLTRIVYQTRAVHPLLYPLILFL